MNIVLLSAILFFDMTRLQLKNIS